MLKLRANLLRMLWMLVNMHDRLYLGSVELELSELWGRGGLSYEVLIVGLAVLSVHEGGINPPSALFSHFLFCIVCHLY